MDVKKKNQLHLYQPRDNNPTIYDIHDERDFGCLTFD